MSYKAPHRTMTELKLGELSILFSYGNPIGYEYHGAIYVNRMKLTRTQERHLFTWRDPRQQVDLSPRLFEQDLLRCIKEESLTLTQMEHQRMTAPQAENETPVEDPTQIELDELTQEAEEDEEENSGSDDDEDLDQPDDDDDDNDPDVDD